MHSRHPLLPRFHNHLLQLLQVPPRRLAPRSDPVANDLALHSLGQLVLDEKIQVWHHRMEI